MEQKKDTQHFSDTHKGQKDGFAYIMRKAEKLTTALYLVTDIMSDKEPMKWKARETGVELLSDIAVGSTRATSERMTDLRNIMKKTEKVISFLDIAQSTHLMSEMNAVILKKEYIALKHDIEAEWNRIYEDSHSMLTRSFFDVEKDVRQLESGAPASVQAPAVQVSLDAKLSPTKQTHPNTTPLHPVEPMTGEERRAFEGVVDLPRAHPERLLIVAKTHRPIVTLRDAIEHAQIDVARDDRRKIILALIKQKPELTVKDISKSIPAVSEKTIQRELLSMVAEGVLEKRGERRWSSYALKRT